MLKRALLSLSLQTYENWIAIVLDDSEKPDCKMVVKSFQAKKIIYRKNKSKLGAAGNLNHAFYKFPFINGKYAFILEDDNALHPNFIQVGLQLIKEKNVNIVSFNQRVIQIKNNLPVHQKGTVRPANTCKILAHLT